MKHGHTARGLVLASRQAAADAGALALRTGGNAVDAVIAAAAALTVVDPANCGLGGYGGFMVVDSPRTGTVQCVDFNTVVPGDFQLDALQSAARIGPFFTGGPSVSVPAVVPGLFAAHAAFGHAPLADLFQPAVDLATRGFEVSGDLARALRWAEARQGPLSRSFRALYFSKDRAPAPGQVLRLEPVAEVLRLLAAQGLEAWRRGPLPDVLCASVQAAGGALRRADLATVGARVEPARLVECDGLRVFGPDPITSAFGVLGEALRALDDSALGASRSPDYTQAMLQALRRGAQQRSAWRPLVEASQHTTHLCAADAQGTLVSCTFTHGPLWFGSGVVAGQTGLVMNCGANLYATPRDGGPTRALTYLTPVSFHLPDGSRHVLGSPGGHRIPAIVLQAIIERRHYGTALEHALGLARLSLGMAGEAECEAPLLDVLPQARVVVASDYFGPASGISCAADGRLHAARDPRFESGAATA